MQRHGPPLVAAQSFFPFLSSHIIPLDVQQHGKAHKVQYSYINISMTQSQQPGRYINFWYRCVWLHNYIYIMSALLVIIKQNEVI